jgi:tetratricopeptide (TPR) repeat protein/TolB-like protein
LKAAGQQISLEQGLDYAIQLADGLTHAHQHGVIHRDIKAGNMLFAESGVLKITDFGLAKMAEGIDVTQTGSVMGTPATMSPEQAQGQEADRRSDIFSAGVVLFEMFTGELPFKGAHAAAVLYQVVHAEAPPLGKFRPGIPIAMEQVVAKALKKGQAERYQTAAGLASDLRGLRRELIFESSTNRTMQETVAMTAAVPARRRRGWVPKAAVAAAAVGIAIAVWWGWPEVQDRVDAVISRVFTRAPKRLAILPFKDVGGNEKDQAYLDGFGQVLVSQLTSLEGPGGSLVVVVSPEEIKNSKIDSPGDAGKRWGATLVMTGKVVRAGQQPQLVIELQDTQSLTVLHSQTVDIWRGDLTGSATRVVRMLELGLNASARENLRAGASSNPAATRAYIEGLGYMQRPDRVQNLDLAELDFREALGADPGYALAEAGLAAVLRLKYELRKNGGTLKEAEDHAANALKLNDRLAAVHITMAQVRVTKGDFDSAERELQTALKIEPANARAYRELGKIFEGQKKYDDAEKTYQKSIDVRPSDAAGYVWLGIFYYHREQLQKAELSWRRATELTPDNPMAHLDLGLAYLKTERYVAAIDEFSRSVKIEPSPQGYTYLGGAHYFLRHYEDAAEPYSRAVDLARDDSSNWGNLADAYRYTPALHDKAEATYRTAIGLIEKEIQVDQRNPRLHARLAMYYASIGERQQALSHLAEALRLDPLQAYVQFRAALVYVQAGQDEAAAKALKLARKAGQPMAEILAAPPLDRLRSDPRLARMAGLLP